MDANLELPTLSFRLLGPFSSELDGSALVFPRSRKTRALLAHLVSHEKPQSRIRLSEIFFASAADPAGSLRWSVSRLKAILPKGTIVADRSQIQLSHSMFTTDLGKLEAVVASDEEENLCRYFARGYPFDGDFLSDLVFDDLSEFETWRLTTQAHYERLKIQAITRFLEVAPESPHNVAIAEQLVALDNHNERSWCYLVEYLVAAGNHREASKVLEMARRQLAKNNIQPLGLLGKISSRASEREATAPLKQSSARAAFSRPAIAVLPCIDPIGTQDSEKLHKVTAALFAASSSNRSCVTLSFGVGLSLDLQSENGPDYILESRLVVQGAEGELSVDFVDVATRVCLFSWREQIANLDEFDIGSFVTGYFSKRFELDIQLALVAKALNKSEEERTAQDTYYVAASHIYGAQGYSYDKALTLLDKALLLDPGLGCALAAAAWVRTAHPDFNSRADDRALTVSIARRAVELSQDDCFTLAWSAITVAHIERDLHTAMDIVKRALSLNPHSCFALIAGGLTENLLGNDEASAGYLDRAELWGDAEPLTFIIYHGRASIAYQRGDYENAILWGNKCRGRNPNYVSGIRILGAAQSRLGMQEEAAATIAFLQEIDASETIDFYWNFAAYKKRDTVERICADLRKAGLPES